MGLRGTATVKWMNGGCLNHNNEIKGGPRVPVGVPVVMGPVRRLREGVQRRPALLQHQLRRPTGSPFFEQAGYSAVAPSWPDDPPTIELAREDPSVFAGKGIGDIAAYQQQIIEKLDTKPAIIGHSFGGLLAQILAGRGCPPPPWPSTPHPRAASCRCRRPRSNPRPRCSPTPPTGTGRWP